MKIIPIPSSVGRFAFPLIPSETESLPPESSCVVWPEFGNRYAALAVDRIAEALLHQVWGDNADVFMTERHQLLAVTSPTDGDGKTETLLALGPSLTLRVGCGILAVDANCEKPDLTSRLNFSSHQLARLTPVIYPTNYPSLNVLPAPIGVSWEVFHPSMLEEMRQQWPLTILDMPSLYHEETLPLACACDGIYLVVRLGHTSRRAAHDAGRLIRHAGGQLLGCIVIR